MTTWLQSLNWLQAISVTGWWQGDSTDCYKGQKVINTTYCRATSPTSVSGV